MILAELKTSNLVSSLEESATLAISKRVRELKAEGRDVVGLTLGEPDFDTPAHICEAAKQALDDGYTHYPPVSGLPELRQAIVEKFRRDNGLNFTVDNIIVSTGAKQSLYNVVFSLVSPGDEVIIPAPYWVSYEAMVHLARGKVVTLPTSIEDAYKVSAEKLEAAINPATRLIMLSTPSNPTGSMYSREEMAAIAAVLERNPHVHLISDEIYEYLVYEGEHVSFASFESIADRVITVNGFSKGYAMTGWRLGYIAASREIADICEKLQGQITSGANSFAQKGAVEALNGDQSTVVEMREAFRQRRNRMFTQLQEIEDLKVILPDGAFYFYPDFSSYFGRKTPSGDIITTIDDLCLYLIDEVGLALVPGSAFGTSVHARISYAYAPGVLDDAVQRLKTGLGLLQG
ncbi:MAG: pyridoxal phosphate-dependent aminotransferase [Bacteroidia bacterium]